jgi:predicted Zn-dependent protease
VNLERIKESLARVDGATDWVLVRNRAESTTVIRLPRVYAVRSGRFVSSDNPSPREVITSPGETVTVRLFSAYSADGADWVGDVEGQLTADDDGYLRQVFAGLVAACRGQRNKPFPLPGKDERYPEVELADPEIIDLPPAALLARAQGFNDRIIAAAAARPGIEVSNIEIFVRRHRNTVLTSRNLGLEYPSTRVEVEICFLARPKDDKVGEHTARLAARRLRDMDPERIVAEYADAARDIALASPPPNWQGPVVLSGEAAADFLLGSPFGFHSNAQMVFDKSSRHAQGKPVTGDYPLKGEPLNLVSDPLVPFGLRSARLNEYDATPCRPVTIVKDGNYEGLLGGRRYYHYLGLIDRGIAPPGTIGDTLVPAGKRPEAELVADDCVVVRAFSAFSVDPTSGQFAVEIRLGETRRAGRNEPFTSGLLVGNWFEAVADAHYSKELQVYQSYRGPHSVRLGNLKVAG